LHHEEAGRLEVDLKEKVADSLRLIAFVLFFFTVAILVSQLLWSGVPFYVWVVLGIGFLFVFLLSVKLRR